MQRIGAMRFDLFRGQGIPWPDFVEDVGFIETTGAGTCWVLDHYVYPPSPEAQILDSWTALGGLAAVTERIRLGTMVTDAALRHPALLAKQIATVDRISDGRVDVTIGAGHFQEELESLGISFLTPRGRVERLREAVEVVDGLLRKRRLSYEGEHWSVRDATLVPDPVQEPRPPLFVAANGKRGLCLAAERADASVTLGDDRETTTEQAVVSLRTRNDLLDQLCIDLSRDPESLERAYFFGWAIERPFESAESLRDYLGRYGEAGTERFVFSFARQSPNGIAVTRETWQAFAGEILASAVGA
jgi:alkanesulfonate monooxygenase SsuD/methylene tetrahydromethanopterin reductase-like flavin-dependent oxidoreductase (luciferase family)